jgi:hypothetical protein
MKSILLIILLTITGFTYSQDTTSYYISASFGVSNLNSNIAIGDNIAIGFKRGKLQLGLEKSYYTRKVDNLTTIIVNPNFEYQSYSLVAQYDVKRYDNLVVSPSLDFGYTEVALVDRSVKTFFYTENFLKIDKFVNLSPGINITYYDVLFLSAKWRFLVNGSSVGENIPYNTNSNGLLLNIGLRIPIKGKK